MISESQFRILYWLFNISGWTLTSPLGFDWETKQATQSQSVPIILVSRLTSITPIFITLTSFIRFAWLLREGEEDAFILILHVIFAIVFLISSILQVPLFSKVKECVTSINHCTNHAIQFKRLYGKRKLEQRKSLVEIAMKLLICMALVWPFINIAFAFVYLSQEGKLKYVLFAFPYEENQVPWWLIGFLTIFTIASLYRVWIVQFSVLFPILIGLDLIIFILSQIKPNVKSGLTRKELRQPAHGLHAYRCVQILMGEANELFQDFILPVTEFVLVTFNVISNVILISMFHQLGPFALMFATVSFGLLLFQFLFYKGITLTYELSKGFGSAWTRNLEELEGEERKLMRKYIQTCPPIKVKIGSYDFYQKKRLVKTLRKIIMSTRKYLLLFNKF